MINIILKKLAPIPRIDKAKKVVFVGPHPDDIEIGVGGIVAKLIELGCNVTFIICTDGGAGYLNASDTIDNLVERRKEEATAAANYLGVNNVYQLGFLDGGSYNEWDLAVKISEILISTGPDFVLCPDPNLPSEIHPDHIKCANATRSAVIISSNKFVAKRNNIAIDENLDKINQPMNLGYYYTHRPNSYIGFSQLHLNKMFEAIKLHQSQFPIDDKGERKEFNLLEKYLKLRMRSKGWKARAKYAIGIFAMSSLHQHCFPEINDY